MLNVTGLLLRSTSDGDDLDLSYRRVEGNGRAPIVCFLPWRTPYRLALGMGIVPKNFMACYEMPAAIVSSEPELCAVALKRVVEDALSLRVPAYHGKQALTVLGASIGSGPATYFANAVGAKLRSVASADRGDLMLWESPAAREIKARAIRKGYELSDFTEATRGYNPVENLSNLAHDSSFVIGRWDEYVPEQRRKGLENAVRKHAPQAKISFVDAGHVRTIVSSFSAAEALRVSNV